MLAWLGLFSLAASTLFAVVQQKHLLVKSLCKGVATHVLVLASQMPGCALLAPGDSLGVAVLSAPACHPIVCTPICHFVTAALASRPHRCPPTPMVHQLSRAPLCSLSAMSVAPPQARLAYRTCRRQCLAARLPALYGASDGSSWKKLSEVRGC